MHAASIKGLMALRAPPSSLSKQKKYKEPKLEMIIIKCHNSSLRSGVKRLLKRGLNAVCEETSHTVAFDPPQSAAVCIRAGASDGSKEQAAVQLRTLTRAHQRRVDEAQPAIT